MDARNFMRLCCNRSSTMALLEAGARLRSVQGVAEHGERETPADKCCADRLRRALRRMFLLSIMTIVCEQHIV